MKVATRGFPNADSGGSRLTDARENAHRLIHRLPDQQVSALVGLLETIVDPVAAALRNAPIPRPQVRVSPGLELSVPELRFERFHKAGPRGDRR